MEDRKTLFDRLLPVSKDVCLEVAGERQWVKAISIEGLVSGAEILKYFGPYCSKKESDLLITVPNPVELLKNKGLLDTTIGIPNIILTGVETALSVLYHRSGEFVSEQVRLATKTWDKGRVFISI